MILPAPTFKTLPVQPQIVGQVAIGYEIVGIIADPSAVTADGIAGCASGLTTAQTKPINVGGATADIAVNTDLDLPPGVTLARPQQILVRVLVDSIQGSKIIQVAPTVRHRGDQSVVPTPGSVEVTVTGPMPILTTLRPQDVQAIIDVTGLSPGTYNLKPTIVTPSLVRADVVSPEVVKVDVH